MELVVLVIIPSVFIMFFPEPALALMLSIASGTRLCYLFFKQCRTRIDKRAEVWSLGGAAIALTAAFFIDANGLRAALIYLAVILIARFLISVIVYREYTYSQTFDAMRELNAQLIQSIEQLKAEYKIEMSERNRKPEEVLKQLRDKRLQVIELERHYNEQMKILSARLEALDAEEKLRLQEFESQRDDAQQSLFDLQEQFDLMQARLMQSEKPCAFVRDGRRLDCGEIRFKFEEALQRTERELDIFSPYISFKLAKMFKPRLKELLSNPNVTIKIRYSISEPSDARCRITQKAAKMLRKEFKRYPNFKMHRDNGRAKLFICDEKFFVLTGFNLLAYGGDGDDSIEGEFSSDEATLRQYRDEYFSFENEL